MTPTELRLALQVRVIQPLDVRQRETGLRRIYAAAILEHHTRSGRERNVVLPDVAEAVRFEEQLDLALIQDLTRDHRRVCAAEGRETGGGMQRIDRRHCTRPTVHLGHDELRL